jgi:hypothetical protein
MESMDLENVTVLKVTILLVKMAVYGQKTPIS